MSSTRPSSLRAALNVTDAEIAKLFRCGLSMRDIADELGEDVAVVEQIIRAQMLKQQARLARERRSKR